MSLKEVGVIDAIGFLIGILLEFPSGVISDRLGRKQTLLISQSLQFLGSLLITLSSNLFEIGWGFAIFQIGVAFYSGTIESFGYESGVNLNQNYTHVLVRSGFITNFSYLGSLLIGGYLYALNNNFPNLLFSINFLVGVLLCFFINDNFIYQESISDLGSNSKFSLAIVTGFVVIMTLVFSFDYGFLKLFLLEKFSATNTNYWFIFFSTSVSLLITSLILSRITNYSKSLVFSFFLIVFSILSLRFTYIILFFTLSFLAVFCYQLYLKYFNERLENKDRAGAISLFNLFYKLPYVLIALFLGYNLG
jgi:MFS family permease